MMTSLSEIQCYSKLQLVTKENQTLFTHITARLMTSESTNPLAYTVLCKYCIFRDNTDSSHLYQNRLSADQDVIGSRKHRSGCIPSWHYYKERKSNKNIEFEEQDQGHRIRNNDKSYSLVSGMLDGLPQSMFVRTNFVSGHHNEQTQHGRASAAIQHEQSEFSTREQYQQNPCGSSGTLAPRRVSPQHGRSKIRTKINKTAREEPYPMITPSIPMNNGNECGGYLERLQGTVDLTCVFGQKDTYNARGTIRFRSSRCSLAELRKSSDRNELATSSMAETANSEPFYELGKHLNSNMSNAYSSYFNESMIYENCTTSRQYVDSTHLQWLGRVQDNKISNLSSSGRSISSKESLGSNWTWKRHRNRNAAQEPNMDFFIFPREDNEGRNEKYHARPNSCGMRSVEESVAAAFECLSNEQIKLLDEATCELSETAPYMKL
ncbi:uncharacterized protein LOC129266026 [Lytechinus pictus]|uniref:uncharacterized protein LOC129266026 n=1 Tax=Lytechinus pictus TaxID=7653 RepID=UPI0030BA1F14